jgi:hypothetical protein
MSLIAFTTFNIVAGSFAIVALAVYGVARALRTAGWEPARASRGVTFVATLLIG